MKVDNDNHDKLVSIIKAFDKIIDIYKDDLSYPEIGSAIGAVIANMMMHAEEPAKTYLSVASTALYTFHMNTKMITARITITESEGEDE